VLVRIGLAAGEALSRSTLGRRGGSCNTFSLARGRLRSARQRGSAGIERALPEPGVPAGERNSNTISPRGGRRRAAGDGRGRRHGVALECITIRSTARVATDRAAHVRCVGGAARMKRAIAAVLIAALVGVLAWRYLATRERR